jgi:hypothetical protein
MFNNTYSKKLHITTVYVHIHNLLICVVFTLSKFTPKFSLTKILSQSLHFTTGFYSQQHVSNKRKAVSLSHSRRQGERKYSSYSYLIWALDGGDLSASRPGRAAPRKGPPVPIAQETGWAPEPVWTQRLEEKSFCLCRGSNLDRPVVQSIGKHYAHWATRLFRLTLG